MHTRNHADPPVTPSASDISLEKHITKILFDYGLTSSQMNAGENQKPELNADNSREQLHLHIVASASEAAILRDLYDTKIANVLEKLEAYMAYQKEVHGVLKGEIKKIQHGIKALALAHELQNLNSR